MDIFLPSHSIRGLTGKITHTHIAVEAAATIENLGELTALPTNDIDLKRMAGWAMNYLVRTPRAELNYEPVFQCHPLKCPPVPSGQDVVVPCDTDARMNWEWYYMREISASTGGKEIEEGFHRRMLAYVQEDGAVLAHPGCYNEGDIDKVYRPEDAVFHVWGATKILHALAEDYRRNGNAGAASTGKKIIQRLKRLAVFPEPGICYFPGGMGAVRPDGSVLPNWWNKQPAPLVEPLVNFYLAAGDAEALDFARAYAEGILAGSQPDGIRIGADGNFGGGHGHATMHALWGIAHLAGVTGEARYLDFVKRSWDWMLSQGTGTGWFPAAPDWASNCNETCCISDMMSTAAHIALSGYPEYFDYLERYLRNTISNLQFILTPEFEQVYRRLHAAKPGAEVNQGLADLAKFQGGIIGGSGLNDLGNILLGGVSGYEMFGCCAPEGMRAIYTAWSQMIERLPESKLGPAGVYVNLCLGRESPWGRVVSTFPESGRLAVKIEGTAVGARLEDPYFLRPPHWAPRDQVHAFRGTRPIPVTWSGSYVRFDAVSPGDELSITYPLIGFTHAVEGLWKTAPDLKLSFEWLGNMVTSSEPAALGTPLFTGVPRTLPPPPDLT